MILIALGSNLAGDFETPEQVLNEAFRAIEGAGIAILARSNIWVTAPVPKSDQPDYCNAVIAVETTLNAQELLRVLHGIEAQFGRIRSETRNEARILDLDLLAYHDMICDNLELTVPHPRMHERGFVLFPLCELNPDWSHPIYGKTAQDLRASLFDQDEISLLKAAA